MKRQFPYCLPLLLLLVAGCQTDAPISDLLEGRQIDYDSAENQKHQSLQYPPDLLSTLQGTQGTVSLSEYTIQSVPVIQAEELAEDILAGKVTYRRSGNLRWVEVDLPPAEAWQAAHNFWTAHLGFVLTKEDAELGVMETDWLDLRERIATPGFLGEYWDKLLNRLQDSGERDKFATRLEKNDSGGSDVYIAHRHIAAVFDDFGFVGYESRESDSQLEIEMMRRLMLYLAGRELGQGENADINEQVAVAEDDIASDYELGGSELLINKPFVESWQLVQVGLNRGGFNIEDRDFQDKIIFIRHSGGPDSDKIFGQSEGGLLTRWFGEEDPLLREIKLVFTDIDDERVRLTPEAVEGEPALTAEQSKTVLELLHQYLP